MSDIRNEELFETIKALPDLKAFGLLCFLFGFECECKHFHDGVEAWVRNNLSKVNSTEINGGKVKENDV